MGKPVIGPPPPEPPKRPQWPNYSDHPIIVGIVVLAAVVAIIVFATGKSHLGELFSPQKPAKIEKPPYSIIENDIIVVNSPDEIVIWLNSIEGAFERDEQKRRLWHKTLKVAGKIGQITATKYGVYFGFPSSSAHPSMLINVPFHEIEEPFTFGDSIVVSCVIEGFTGAHIHTSGCKIEKIAK